MLKPLSNFGLKGVRFETTNSQFHSLDANGRRVTVKGADYDMKGAAKWENGNLFLGKVEAAVAGLKGNLSGKFFGPSAAEIGGTYGLQNKDGSEQLDRRLRCKTPITITESAQRPSENLKTGFQTAFP